MRLLDDDGGVILRPTILNCAHSRLSAERATLRCFRGWSLADIVASRSHHTQAQPLPHGASPSVIVVDQRTYPARTHLAEFYLFLWAVYFKENLEDLVVAARYDAFADEPPQKRRHVARRTDAYPAEGLGRLSDAAAIAALVGGRMPITPFDELLTRIEPTPARHQIYTIGYSGLTPAQVEHYVEQTDALLIDVRKSATSRILHWNGDALRAQFGDRYQWWPELSNENDVPGGPIQLSNPALIIDDVRRMLADRPIILLCGCANHSTCHRTRAAQYLAMWLNARITHLPDPTGTYQ